MVAEVAELTVRGPRRRQGRPGRPTGGQRAALGDRQAREIGGYPPRPLHPETGCRGGAGADEGHLDGTVAFRVRAAVNSFILLDSDRPSLLPPHPARAVFANETVEEVQAVDC